MKVLVRLIIVGLVVAACGGSAATTTTAAAPTTTTGSAQTGDTVAFDDLPAECKDAVRGMLRAIEPVVRDIDFESATLEELDEMGTQLEEQTAEFQATLEESCPEIGGEDSQEALLDLARSDAPGAVAYLEFVFRMTEGFTDGAGGGEVSGDCETDIAAVQEIVDRGGTMQDLTIAELSKVSNLMGAIGQECSLDRFSEFFDKADIKAFVEGTSSDG